MSEKRNVFFCFLLMLSWLVASSRAQTAFQNPVKLALKEGQPVIGATITATVRTWQRRLPAADSIFSGLRWNTVH
jgi:hypothetical protein